MARDLRVLGFVFSLLLVSSLAYAAFGTGGGGGYVGTPTPTATPTPTPTATPTPSATATIAPTSTPSASPSVTDKGMPVTYCSQLATLRDRVACKLERHESNALSPEACRDLHSDESARCRSDYTNTEPCFDQPIANWVFCGRQTLKLGDDIAAAKAACASAQNSTQCIADLRWNVFALEKFRLYALEEKAEKLLGLGADKNTVVDFITAIETDKKAFDAAQTIADKKAVLAQAKQQWEAFKATALAQINAKQ